MTKGVTRFFWPLVSTALLSLLILKFSNSLYNPDLVVREEQQQRESVVIVLPESTSSENCECSAQKRTEFLEESEKIWQKFLLKRHEEVEKTGLLTNVIGWKDRKFDQFWDYFQPAFGCPYPMERIGRVGNGGKWICGFSGLETLGPLSCIVYSFGVGHETSFEAEIVNRSNCEIWAFDPTVEGMGSVFLDLHPLIHFQPYRLADATDDANGTARTLTNIMTNNDHDWIDILKVDIEGAEFDVFNQIMDEYDHFPFGQLQIEMHASSFLSFRDLYEWWEKMEGKGLRAVRMEQNNYDFARAQKPFLMNVVFLNVGVQHRIIE